MERLVMGLLGSIIAKGVTTAATNSTIKTVGNAVATVIATSASKNSNPQILSCPYCGTAIAVAGAKFCIGCGNEI